MGGYKDLNLRRAELGAAGVAMTLGLALETRSPRGLGFRLLGFLPNASYREMQRLFRCWGIKAHVKPLTSKL